MSGRGRLVALAVTVVMAVALTACDRGSGASIKVVIADYSKDHTRPFWQALAETYTKQTGVKVDLQVIDWNSIDQQVSTMIQNNQPPDVLNLNAFASYAKDGLLYPADDVLSPKTQDDFLDAFVRGGEYRGKLYGFPILSSARAFFYNRTSSPRPASPRRRRPGTSSSQAAAEDPGARRRHDRLRAAARPRGGAGRVVHLDVEQRRRLEVGRGVGDQQRQERADAPVPGRPRQQAQGHPGQPRQDQPHRRRVPALQGRQGRHGHGLQPARRPSSTPRARSTTASARCRPTPAPASPSASRTT